MSKTKYAATPVQLATLILTDLAIAGFLSLIFLSGKAVDWYLVNIENFYITENAETIKSVLLPVSICAGVGAVTLLASLHLLMMNIIKGQPFIKKNILLLRVIAFASVFIAVCYCPIYPLFKIYIALILSVIFAFLALILLVLANVFKRAIEIKDENDYTI